MIGSCWITCDSEEGRREREDVEGEVEKRGGGERQKRGLEGEAEERGGGERGRGGVEERGEGEGKKRYGSHGYGGKTISNSLTSGAIQGNVPTRDTFVVCR